MENVLLNLANRELLGFCKENGIDPSGTHVEKILRGFKYYLIQDETNTTLVTVTFSKNNTPQFALGNTAKEQRTAKIERLRSNMPGYILGDLTPFATDSDVLEICDLNDRKAEIHNRALTQKRFAK